MLQWLNVDILYIPIVVYIVPQKNKALQKVHTVSGPATVPRALTSPSCGHIYVLGISILSLSQIFSDFGTILTVW
jgi:hypothetical protein